MNRASSSGAFLYGSRAVSLLCITAFALGLGTGLLREPLFSVGYFWRNEAPDPSRGGLLIYILAWTALAAVLGLLAFVRSLPGGVASAQRLYQFALRTSPLGPLACIPLLLRWDIWVAHELAFCIAAILVSLSFGRAVRASVETLPLGGDSPLHALMRPRLQQDPDAKHWWARDPMLLAALAAALAYISWFAYHTVVFHQSVRTGWDTSIEDNILWNLSHGGPFFKASPALGPTGAHFRRHATLISYLLAPFYLLKPGAATVLVIQSVLQGAASIPLFLFARRHVGQGIALFVTIAYLFHPALQESNLFEVHYVKFGPVFLWTTLWLLDSGRNRGALVAAALTVLVREDVASWVILLGAWGLMCGRDARTSGLILALGCVYVGVMKFVVMPAVGHGHDELTFLYAELVPKGKSGFGAVLSTVFGNPAFTLESMFDPAKLLYFLQLFLPLAFIPLRRTIGWLALMPAFIYCFISTHYGALVDIHFQYSAHVLTFLFPALVLVLGEVNPPLELLVREAAIPLVAQLSSLRHLYARRLGLCSAMLVGTLLGSYQFGAVLQQNTSRGGPVPYKFGWDDEGRERHRAMQELLEVIPPLAPIVASAFTTPQVSARPNAYCLTIGVWDAEYIIAASTRREQLPDERSMLGELLGSGTFGVLKVVGPFFVAKRGADTAGNHALLRQIGAL
jgi:uncharacterized membrane protein